MYWSVWFCVVSLFIASIIHWVYKWRNPKCNGKLPPGSMGFPLIGETIQFFIPSKSLDVSSFIRKRMKKYGPLFCTNLVGRPVVVSSDPDFNYHIFQQEGRLVEIWYLDSFARLVGQDASQSTAASGYVHKYLRNLVLAHFGTEVLKDKLLSKAEDMIRTRLHDWSKLPALEFKTCVSSVIYQFTANELFSYDIKKMGENFSERFTNIIQAVASFPLNIPGTTFHKCLKNQKEVIKLIRDILKERKVSPESRKGDFLDQIVDDIKKEKFLSDDFIVLVMFGILLASFETISATLTLAVKLLIENPSVMQELIEEHEAILKNRENSNSGISWKEYKSMTFTHQVINEALRLASVAPGILRRAIKDIQVNGYTIPAGWTIMVVPAALQLSPDAFVDPLTFNPSRWKDMGVGVVAKNFIPFGGGSRLCAGAEFTKVLMTTFFHVLVTNYRLTKIKGGQIARSPALTFGNGLHINISKKHG
ncbi:cytochrome P450 87A3-like [Vitis riparia]|uniref:cytochrome P450 87A3-like n=1 Tax=Vitis riparia TaxID=96939 RepID=UPI00155A0B4B|nr:cytochrome P450 87A3-like [Vitis riparia]